MPELEDDAAAGDMDRARRASPPLNLLGAVDAGRRDIALTLGSHLRRFRDDEACARALRIIKSAFSWVGTLPAAARLRVSGAMAMRFGRVSGPSATGVKRFDAVLGRSCIIKSPMVRGAFTDLGG